MALDDPYTTIFEYTDYLELGLAYAPITKSVLLIGLGGGSAVKRMWRDFPALQLHAVEIDPEVVRVARRWFALPRDCRGSRSRCRTAAASCRRHDERWDMIVVDAYFATRSRSTSRRRSSSISSGRGSRPAASSSPT